MLWFPFSNLPKIYFPGVEFVDSGYPGYYLHRLVNAGGDSLETANLLPPQYGLYLCY
jgi:hypothetical protein